MRCLFRAEGGGGAGADGRRIVCSLEETEKAIKSETPDVGLDCVGWIVEGLS